MALTNYAGLKQEVIEFTGRDDLSSRFDAFLDLAEAKIYRTNSLKSLRVREMETVTTLVTVSGTNTVALPADFLEARSMKIDYSGNKYELRYLSPSSVDEVSSGMPSAFTLRGTNIVFDSIPDDAYNLTLAYYAQPVALSATNSTNVILTNYPDIYLNACMAMVYDFTTEPEMSQFCMEKAQASIQGAMKSDERAIRKIPAARVRGVTP